MDKEKLYSLACEIAQKEMEKGNLYFDDLSNKKKNEIMDQAVDEYISEQDYQAEMEKDRFIEAQMDRAREQAELQEAFRGE